MLRRRRYPTTQSWISPPVAPEVFPFGCSQAARRCFGAIPPLDRITQTASPRLDVRMYKGEEMSKSPTSRTGVSSSSGGAPLADNERAGGVDQTFHFALQEEDRGWYDRGVSLEAKAFIAEAEEAYTRSWAALHDLPGGALVEHQDEVRDAETDEVVAPARKILTAPFGETYVPSNKVAFAMRGQVGELADQQAQMKQARGDGPAWDMHAQLNLRKERQLDALLCAPDMPLLEKAVEVERRLISQFFPHRLVLQPGTAEVAMTLFARASLRCRITGEPSEPAAMLTADHPSMDEDPKLVNRIIASLPHTRATAGTRSSGFPHAVPTTEEEKMQQQQEEEASSSSPTSNPTPLVCRDPREESQAGQERVVPTPPSSSPPPSPPSRPASPRVVSNALPYHTMETLPFFPIMRQLYTHQKKFAVAPTAQVIESMMVTLTAVRCPQALSNEKEEWHRGGRHSPAFHLAQRLLLDCDRFVVLPSHTTLTAYIRICHIHNEMGFAIAQLRHAMKNLSIPLDADMTAALLRGLTQCGQVEEALALLARLQRVPLTVELLNASLETLLFSTDPLSCFSTYEACLGDGASGGGGGQLRPNAETFTLLLLACEQSGQWGASRWIAAEMQRHRVKGTPTCLNLLLKGLLKERRTVSAAELHATMRRKDVTVWAALERGLLDAAAAFQGGETNESIMVPTQQEP